MPATLPQSAQTPPRKSANPQIPSPFHPRPHILDKKSHNEHHFCQLFSQTIFLQKPLLTSPPSVVSRENQLELVTILLHFCQYFSQTQLLQPLAPPASTFHLHRHMVCRLLTCVVPFQIPANLQN